MGGKNFLPFRAPSKSLDLGSRKERRPGNVQPDRTKCPVRLFTGETALRSPAGSGGVQVSVWGGPRVRVKRFRLRVQGLTGRLGEGGWKTSDWKFVISDWPLPAMSPLSPFTSRQSLFTDHHSRPLPRVSVSPRLPFHPLWPSPSGQHWPGPLRLMRHSSAVFSLSICRVAWWMEKSRSSSSATLWRKRSSAPSGMTR